MRMYSIYNRLPRIRMEAVRLVQSGWSVRAVARHFGFTHSAVVKWVARAKLLHHNSQFLPTRSSRPDHHPNEVDPEIVKQIQDQPHWGDGLVVMIGWARTDCCGARAWLVLPLSPRHYGQSQNAVPPL